jgi:hypothetical protein
MYEKLAPGWPASPRTCNDPWLHMRMDFKLSFVSADSEAFISEDASSLSQITHVHVHMHVHMYMCMYTDLESWLCLPEQLFVVLAVQGQVRGRRDPAELGRGQWSHVYKLGRWFMPPGGPHSRSFLGHTLSSGLSEKVFLVCYIGTAVRVHMYWRLHTSVTFSEPQFHLHTLGVVKSRCRLRIPVSFRFGLVG